MKDALVELLAIVITLILEVHRDGRDGLLVVFNFGSALLSTGSRCNTKMAEL